VAVDHLAEEIARRVPALPPEVLFLQGMAARQRKDRQTEERCFRQVWEQGRPGHVFAIAAHLFGNLVARRERDTAERAYRDSVAWNDLPEDQAQVWHSLGNLLARSPARWTEAEAAYRTSLEFLRDPEHQAQVWHSLGNLLARSPARWTEAEAAYRTSLEFLRDPEDQAQVWHSLGNLLARNPARWPDAEAAYRTSLELDPNPQGQAQVYASWADASVKHDRPQEAIRHALDAQRLSSGDLRTLGVVHRVLADAYEQLGDVENAIRALEVLIENNRRLHVTRFDTALRARLANLREGLYAGESDTSAD
jgi:tetratricopeptide (TPR) repeat protein